MGQSAKVSGAANPPFATADGKPANQGTGSKGSFDFLSDPTGDSAKTGGHDFTQDNRPQTGIKDGNPPNPQSIPAGGKILMADPLSVSKTQKGNGMTTDQGHKPFKSLK
jgi:hypothetical protein